MMHSFKRPFLTLLFSMALAAFLPLLLNNLFYIRFRDTILLQQKALTEEALRLSVQQIDGTLLELTTLSMRLDDELQDVSIPDQSGLDSSRRMELFDLSSRLRQELKSGSEYLSAIYLYSALSETAVPFDQPVSTGSGIVKSLIVGSTKIHSDIRRKNLDRHTVYRFFGEKSKGSFFWCHLVVFVHKTGPPLYIKPEI